MNENLRRLAIEEDKEALRMEEMLWKKLQAGEIDMESFERITTQMRRHAFAAGRYTEQLYNKKGDN